MRQWLLAALLISVTLAGCVGDETESPASPESAEKQPFRFDHPLGGSTTLAPGSFNVTPVTKQILSSNLDGVDIDLSYWLPEEAGPVPVIIQASPYFTRTDAPGGSQNFGQWMHDVFVPHGYAYVQLAIRSTAASGGCDDFRGPNMAADMHQAINWIMDQEWSTGGVSLIGKSYPGSTPWYAAGTGNEHVKTIVPVSGSTNAWEVYLRNGTPESRAAIIVPNYGATAATNTDRSLEHKAENFACTEVWEAWAYGVSDAVIADRIHDDFWDERNSKPGVEANYKGSILLVHGLEDWNVDPAVAIPWTQELADSGLKVKQLLGQWAHDHPDQGSEQTRRYDWAQMLLDWFDSELKGLDVDTGANVEVQSNDFTWRTVDSWPPKNHEDLQLFLGNGAMSTESQAHTTHNVLPTTTLRFATTLENDTRIAGLPTIHITATPTGPSGYAGAILYDQSPNGDLKRIGWTGMNFRFADGTETPQVVVPGQELLLKMQLQPMDALVPAGHDLVLEIGPTLAPSDRLPPPHLAPYILHTGDGYGPSVSIPVVSPSEEAFFQPPQP